MAKVTIIDIANRAGVSFKTVSRVLNRHPTVAADLRDRVENAMRELDYRPNRAAQSLKGNRHFTIGFLSGTDREISIYGYSSPYIAEVQRGILSACKAADYNLVLGWIDISSRSFAADLRQQLSNLRVDGLLLTPPLADMPVLLDTLDAFGTLYVRIAPGIERERSFTVMIDERKAGHAMTRYLQDLGHRRIGFVGGPPGHIAAGERLTGHAQALAERGDGPPLTANGDFTLESGMAAGLDLLRGPAPPTAIFAANDDMAAGVIAAAHKLGRRVPEEVSVAGFDDSLAARLTWPSLTTVHQPIARMSALASEQLIQASASGRQLEPAQRIMPFRIVERMSTAPRGADRE